MGLVDWTLRKLHDEMPPKAWGAEFVKLSLEDEIRASNARSWAVSPTRTYRLPSVAQALGVPAIQRAVSLIAGTTGMLSMQGFRDGSLMDTPPPLIQRPDPYEAPQTFYSTTAANMAKYGEFVWWIASRDSDNNPSALVNVPLRELNVESTDDRLRPRYRWGSKVSTRWTPATPEGQFVHKKYPLSEPLALRGDGPLQLCRTANSIAVEADAWAAQFFAEGGDPSVIIKHAAYLSPALDADGLNEADRLRAQWVGRPHNVPRVIDQTIESIDYKSPNPEGAQMHTARLHQRGDAALMFGMSGHWVEYVQQGTSLTYQNLEMAFEELIKACLQPLYLEPIEQAMSDLLTRSTVARFNVKGFLRADIKTRFEVHGIAIDKGIYGPDYAQREEGILPGDVEFAPVPYSPPSAVPTSIPRLASMSDFVRCPNPACNKAVARSLGPGSDLDCPRCKTSIKTA